MEYNGKVKLIVYNGKMKKETIMDELILRYNLSDSVKWHSNDLIEVNIKTGSPGNYSLFYSVDMDKVSKKHNFPLAIDANNNIILIGTEEVYVTNIFDGKTKYILNLDFANSAIKWLIFERENTYFDQEGHLNLKYTNSAGKWVEEKIKKESWKIFNRLGLD